MPTISEIYGRYPITKGLREHQIRVAAVGAILVDGFDRPVDRDGVIRACLVHDMGNLIKFDLNQLPELLEPEGRDYWEEQKTKMTAKYGADEHVATEAIVRELGLDDKIIGYISSIGFKNTLNAVSSRSFEAKICHYADHRSTPLGVSSLKDRLADGDRRYSKRTDLPIINPKRLQALREASFKLEQQIFQHLKFPPTYITEPLIAPDIAKLANFEF